MKLQEALVRLCALEEEIQVEFDEWPSLKLLKAWPFWPDGTFEAPSSFHTFRLRSKTDGINGLRTLAYEVGIQIAIAQAGVDTGEQSERGLGMHEALMDALSARIMLGDGASYLHNLRSENGATLARLEWPPESGIGYVGLDYTIDLHLQEIQVAGPG